MSSKGGGASGAVSFPTYMEEVHADWLGNVGDAPGTRVDVDIVGAMNAILDPGAPGIKASCEIVCVDESSISNNEGFTLRRFGGTTNVFKFSVDGGGVTGEDYTVSITGGDSDWEVADAISAAINGVDSYWAASSPGETEVVTIVIGPEGASGNGENSETVEHAEFSISNFAGGSDATTLNPYTEVTAYDPKTDIDTYMEDLATYKAFVEALYPEDALTRHAMLAEALSSEDNFPAVDIATTVASIVSASLVDATSVVLSARETALIDASSTALKARVTAATDIASAVLAARTKAGVDASSATLTARTTAATDIASAVLAARGAVATDVSSAALSTRPLGAADAASAALNVRAQVLTDISSVALGVRSQAEADMASVALTARGAMVADISSVALASREDGALDAAGAITHAGMKAVIDVDTLVARANAAAVSIVDSAPVAALIAQFGQRAEVAHLKATNRFAGGMAEINAVQGSAFLFGMALMEAEHTEKVDEFVAQLAFWIFESVVPAYLQVGTAHSLEYLRAEMTAIVEQLRSRAAFLSDHLRSEIASISDHLRAGVSYSAEHLRAEIASIGEHLRAWSSYSASHVSGEGMYAEQQMRVESEFSAVQLQIEELLSRTQTQVESEFSRAHLQTFRDRANVEIRAQAGLTSQVRSGRDAFFNQAVNDLSNMLSQQVTGKQNVATTSVEANRIKFVALGEQSKQDLLYDVEEWLWQLKIFQYGSNVLSGIATGGQVLPERPSQMSTTLSGALSGAAVGMMLPGPAAIPGALAGLGIGAYLGSKEGEY